MKIPAQLFYERFLLALVGGMFCGALSWFHLAQPLDRFIYDLFNVMSPIPAASDITIVAIDEDSLGELGRWPWPRENHVELLRQLRAAGVSAVAMDIIFAEPYGNYPEVDGLLAHELRELGEVVLPVFVGQNRRGDQLREVIPVEMLADAAGALGHVHIEVDSDGVARQVYLREGLGAARWPHFSVALADELGLTLDPLPGVSDTRVLDDPDPSAIIRSHANLITFTGGAGTVSTLPYVDVMKGRAGSAELDGKIVFVGATAAGHVDTINTSYGRIAGVEVSANIFHALRSGQLVQALGRMHSTVLSGALIALSVFGFTRLRPGRFLAAVLAAAILIPLLSLLVFQQFRLWVSPAPILLTLLLVYPLWNWLRLAAAMDFIKTHLSQLDDQNQQWSFGDAGERRQPSPSADPVDTILLQLGAAYRQARQNHELVRETVEQLSSGVVLAEPGGRVLLVNDEARELLGLSGPYAALNSVLAAVELGGGLRLQDLLSGITGQGEHFNCEGVSLTTGRDLLLQGGVIGLDRTLLLFVLTDVSELKQAERRRSEALNFLSHDLRAPLTSVLALIEGSREDAGEVDLRLLRQIERYVRANLSYAENFIQLARLEQTETPRFDDCEARSILDNAVAQLYHLATSRGIDLRLADDDEDVWLRCSRELVERVLINLIDNAMKHSADGSSIDLGLVGDGEAVLFSVRDRGEGIADADLQRIFGQFEQGANARGGAGLGLRFAYAVAQAHGGSISASNNAGGGSVFTLRLPLNPS